MPEIPIAVSLTTDPAGRPAILLQLTHGWVTMQPAGARQVAELLLTAATDLEAEARA